MSLEKHEKIQLKVTFFEYCYKNHPEIIQGWLDDRLRGRKYYLLGHQDEDGMFDVEHQDQRTCEVELEELNNEIDFLETLLALGKKI